MQTAEGVARNNADSYSYEYNLTGHLGNVRYTFNKHPVTAAATGQLLCVWAQKGCICRPKQISLQCKELQEELGQYDYGARFYDPVIARWNVVDQLSESSRRWSPYAYGNDSPIRFIDPDGMQNEDQVKPKPKSKQKEQTGSYTIDFETGMKYHGKGPQSRMEKSAARLAKENNDPVVNKDWKAAENDDEAFKDEDTRLNTQEGGHKNPGNYNKNASPGKKKKEKEAVASTAQKSSVPSSDDDSKQKTEPNKIVSAAGRVLTVALFLLAAAAALSGG